MEAKTKARLASQRSRKMDDLVLELIADTQIERANRTTKVACAKVGFSFGRVEKLAKIILHGVLIVGLPMTKYVNKVETLLDLQLVNIGQNFQASWTIGDGQLR
jgi:hypothetical protein